MKSDVLFPGGFSKWLVFLILAVGASTCLGANSPVVPDGAIGREKYAAEIKDALTKEKFEFLERTAKELRETKATFPEGRWKLAAFYDGLQADSQLEIPLYWYGVFVRLDKWKKAYPNSITQRVAHAAAYLDWAWNARGGGWANSVKPEGWKLFGERIAKAHAILTEAEKLPEKCPHWFAVMQTVALAEGWKRDDYETLYQRAVKTEPTYCTYYFKKAYHLLPRWHGEPGEWERYAEEVAGKVWLVNGITFYTRIAWANSEYYDNLFKETAIKWPMMKEGFRELEKEFPNSSWNLNNFCSFAFQAGDMETTRELLTRIGDHPYAAAWPPGSYEKARRWAMPETAKPSQAPRAVLTVPHPGSANGISFSPDGKNLAVAYDNGTAVVWDVTAKKPAWTLHDLPDPVSSTAFSPDGKLLAIGTGFGGSEMSDEGEGLVKVYDVKTRKERTTIGNWIGGIGCVKFTPDGKTLVMVGGEYDKKSEGKFWDVATGKINPLGWPEQHTHHFEFLALAPDNRTLALECGQAINVWDMTNKKFILETKQYALRRWVRGLAFSPDGTMLAAGVGPLEWGSERSNPGGIVIWDVAGWKKRTPGIKTRTGGLGPVAFSPDSKLLVGGGHEGCIRVWEIASGKEIATLYGHEKIIRSVAFSPDGKTIASSSADGTVRLWNTPVP